MSSSQSLLEFSPQTAFATGARPFAVAIADLNGDGIVDLTVANRNDSTVSILLGDGSGGFSASTDFATGINPHGLAIADFDGDGDADLAVANRGSNNVSVLLGNGLGSFSAPTNIATGTGPRNVTIADLNGDGVPDLVVTNQNSDNISILLGDGSGGFSTPTNLTTGNDPMAVAIADFNGDGHSDLAVTNRSDDNISIWLGNGDGSFSSPSNFVVGDDPYSIATGDLNGDGNIDLVVGNRHSDDVSVLLGDGSGSFSASTDIAVGTEPRSVAIADLDGDGHSDIVTANYASHNVSVLLGDGSGSFSSPINIETESSPLSVAINDLDQDGDLDIVTANYSSNNVSVLLNTTPIPQAPEIIFFAGIEGEGSRAATVGGGGDINGDGFTDIIIGAPQADVNGINQAGETYVVFGGANGFDPSLTLADLDGTNGFVIQGIEEADRAGFSVSNAGDINNDGYDDIVIGTEQVRTPTLGENNKGVLPEAYVVLGNASGFAPNINLADLDGSDGFKIVGIDSNTHSTPNSLDVSNAGDVNNDGIDDLLIGEKSAKSLTGRGGGVHVIYGNTNGSTPVFDVSNLDGTNGITFAATKGGNIGESVSAGGDINGDGINDFIIGAGLGGANGYHSGQTYVVFGQAGGFSVDPTLGIFDLDTLDGTNGFVVHGIDVHDQSGQDVSSAGDFNNDGYDDILIGAPEGDASGNASGEAYLVYGKASGFDPLLNPATLDGTNGFVINPIEETDRIGGTVSGVGDINGDGYDDILVAGLQAGNSGEQGEAYVVFGGTDVFNSGLNLADLDGTNGFRLNGNGRFGSHASAAGDINNDGYDDLLIGAAFGKGLVQGAHLGGRSYVLFGQGEPFVAEVNVDAL
ncbi:MAG: VCBS repeat-containing protein [Cyanobacteria bacterium P01_F01_bin.150]